MAEDNKADAEAPKPSMLSKLIPILIVVLVSAVLALVLFNFVLRPRLGTQEAAPELPSDSIPAETMLYEMAEAQATVMVDSPDQAAPLLIYQLALVCKDQMTYTLVETRKAFFSARLTELFRNRTRSELNDPYVQESIRKQATQKANAEIRKFSPAGTEEILEVLYLKFTIFDL
jgi:flagellar basal body-associated protein FliL